MTYKPFNTPIAFFIFNRPVTTQQVFEVIRQVQPTQLFIIADGPRVDKPEDAPNCAQTRAIVEQIDWDCQVFKKFSDVNLGCGRTIAGGLDWVFSQVEEAIIVEDDLLPDPSFFTFCAELLEKYRFDERVMDISGFNPIPKWLAKTQSYYFVYAYIGNLGWATWRRAWQMYDFRMTAWSNEANKQIIAQRLKDKLQFEQWSNHFDQVLAGDIDTWDYQWTFTKLLHYGVSIVPSKNLIKTIGFGEMATHTTDAFNPLMSLPVFSMESPLRHPEQFLVKYCLDAGPKLYRNVQVFFRKIQSKFRRVSAKVSRAYIH